MVSLGGVLNHVSHIDEPLLLPCLLVIAFITQCGMLVSRCRGVRLSFQFCQFRCRCLASVTKHAHACVVTYSSCIDSFITIQRSPSPFVNFSNLKLILSKFSYLCSLLHRVSFPIFMLLIYLCLLL